MELSDQGIELLRRFEGCRLVVYLDIAGKPTIGIGHLLSPREIEEGVFASGITEDQAVALLRADTASAANAVKRLVKVPLTGNEFDVLVSFVFNEGGGALATSTLLAQLNKGLYATVPAELLRWDKFTDPKTGRLLPSPGLALRRRAEGHVWSYGHDDNDAAILAADAARVLDEEREAAALAYARQFDLRDIALPMGAHGLNTDSSPEKDPSA